MTNKINIRVFPDFMASGFWKTPEDGHGMIEASQFEGIVPDALLLAVKYWHEVWEFIIADEFKEYKCSAKYKNRWEEDGKYLVELMSQAQEVYNFIYVES